MDSQWIFLMFWLPVVLAAVMFGWVGLRGKLIWKKSKRRGEVRIGKRYCGKCGYDLQGMKGDGGGNGNACPECGLKLVVGVNVLQGERGVKWLWVGMAGFAVVWFGVVDVGMRGAAWVKGEDYGYPSAEAYMEMSLEELGERHAAFIEDRDWRVGSPMFKEFERRLGEGELNKAFVKGVAERELAKMKKSVEDWEGGLRVKDAEMIKDWREGQLSMWHKARMFLGHANEAGMLDDDLFVNVMAGEGGVDRVEAFERMREGRHKWDIRFVWGVSRYGSDYIAALYAREMRLDGKVVEIRGQSKSWSGYYVTIDEELAAGWHDLEVDFVMPVVKDPQNKFRFKYELKDGLESLRKHAQVKRIVGDEGNWLRERIKKRFYVYGKDEVAVPVSVDAADEMIESGNLKLMRVNRLDWHADHGGNDEAMGVMLKWKVPRDGTWFGHDCVVVLGEREKKLGRIGGQGARYGDLVIEERRSFNIPGWQVLEYRVVLDGEDREWLNGGEGKVVVELRPNARLVEEKPEVERVWGKVMRFEAGKDFELVDLRKGGE
ncbi:hypothetical protein JD969_07515 [Planctomycetota bacterium]|nr:hypothetical protein JD969_07515 [Planctomycetota bacterium]